MTTSLPDWHGNGDAMRALQTELATQVVLRDGFPKSLRTVAGFDVGFEDDGAITRAAVVLLDANTLTVIDQQVARLPTRMPYIPGLLSFRELPALLEALALLKHPPDLAFVDGHGIAHPRRLGIAAHFGVATGLPSIGVGKSVLIGEAKIALHDMRGAFTPLRDGKTQIGWLLRSKPGCLPLVVSPGHRVAMPSAPELVMRFVTTYRLPEPTRLADRIASRRDSKRS
ncbi:MAG TPA: deoxyribonuclease V [Thermomonas sp.]|jgi:deoxyribonuclease V|uniref:deoxyribonuclease V n=1 Tax=Thermomonas sp. TaxID=1971895 RepID=UPI002BD81917|nr:deoxyribonuclease V [Thermomonas sp.]HOV96242.1 deoxyribonuclease V [Thermomonas sp.]